MSPLDGLGNGTSFTTPAFFWPLLAVTVAIAIAIAIANVHPVWQGAGRARPRRQPVRHPRQPGRQHRLARCPTCGALAPRDGELKARPRTVPISAERLDLQMGRTGHAICVTA
jgi:hypothetical protein